MSNDVDYYLKALILFFRYLRFKGNKLENNAIQCLLSSAGFIPK